jgi:hypothetical protein
MPRRIKPPQSQPHQHTALTSTAYSKYGKPYCLNTLYIPYRRCLCIMTELQDRLVLQQTALLQWQLQRWPKPENKNGKLIRGICLRGAVNIFIVIASYSASMTAIRTLSIATIYMHGLSSLKAKTTSSSEVEDATSWSGCLSGRCLDMPHELYTCPMEPQWSPLFV